MEIGDIGNYYGGLHVEKTSDNKYIWGIEDYCDTTYEEIPKYLYDALTKFQNSKNKEKK